MSTDPTPDPWADAQDWLDALAESDDPEDTPRFLKLQALFQVRAAVEAQRQQEMKAERSIYQVWDFDPMDGSRGTSTATAPTARRPTLRLKSSVETKRLARCSFITRRTAQNGPTRSRGSGGEPTSKK